MPSLRQPDRIAPLRALLPGLALTLALALVATALHRTPGLTLLSPPILATALGIAVRNLLGAQAAAQPGQSFVLRRLLRLAIVLLGFQISVGQILALGLSGVAIVLATVPATYLFTGWLGRRMGLDPRLTTLIASGTSICGASAIVATNTVVAAPDEDVAYAIACITLFGALSMFLYPLLAPIVGVAGGAYGLWSGASIHEVAQAVAAAFQGGEAAGHAGVVAKLLRVALLAPLVMLLALQRRRRGAAHATQPWFLLGFVAVIGLNSLAPPPVWATDAIGSATSFLMTMALAAMGLATNFRALVRRGARPLVLAGTATLFIGGSTLLLIRLAA